MATVLKKAKWSFVATLAAAALASISVSLIPFTGGIEEGKNNVFSYVVAAAFWAGLLLTFAAAFCTKCILGKTRKDWIAKGRLPGKQPIGLVSFSKDRRMWILYGTTGLGLVLIATDILWRYVPEEIMFPVISITILSLAIHCVIDGKYYQAYKRIKESVNNETNLKA